MRRDEGAEENEKEKKTVGNHWRKMKSREHTKWLNYA